MLKRLESARQSLHRGKTFKLYKQYTEHIASYTHWRWGEPRVNAHATDRGAVSLKYSTGKTFSGLERYRRSDDIDNSVPYDGVGLSTNIFIAPRSPFCKVLALRGSWDGVCLSSVRTCLCGILLQQQVITVKCSYCGKPRNATPTQPIRYFNHRKFILCTDFMFFFVFSSTLSFRPLLWFSRLTDWLLTDRVLLQRQISWN